MTPEELDKAKWDEACARADKEYVGTSTIRLCSWVKQRSADHYRQMTIENWQPSPKPSPRVMAMREWLKTVYAHDSHKGGIERGKYDKIIEANSYQAGYAAAVKEAEPLVEVVRHVANCASPNKTKNHPAINCLVVALTTYLTAIGEETP